jgi:DNA polymerase alpha subunit A
LRAICCFDVCFLSFPFLSFPFLSSSFPFSSILQPGSEEPEPASFAQRAYHPDAVTRSQGALQIDVEWYLNQQILPPISRLCEPIEGTSTAMLAERLGLDGSKFARKTSADDDLQDLCDFVPTSRMEDWERFSGTKPWSLTCLKCGTTSEFPGAVNKQNGKSGLFCVNPSCGAEFWGAANEAACFSRFSNLLTMRLRQDKLKYYEK